MNFSEITLALHGDTGRQWLDALPALLETYAQRWDLSISPPFENLSYNYVTPASRADGTPVVLKLGVPNDELRAEIAALRHFDGQGMVRLLAADDENCTMLLERVSPGKTLWEAEDEFASARLLDVMPQLWKPYRGEYPFASIADWGRGFSRLRGRHDGGTGNLDARMVDKAEKLFAELLASSADPVLLHGDLHHDNVLAAQEQRYLAIDPKGVLGEPAYEVGAFLRNPLPGLLEWESPRKLTERRVDMIVERLGFDRQRIIDWGFAQAVLSAIWCDEGGVDCGDEVMQIAEILTLLE